MKIRMLIVCALVTSGSAAAMDFRAGRLAMYSKSEAIAGEEFLAANEEIVDYLATLTRGPRGGNPKMFRCQIKDREIEPTVLTLSGPQTYGSYVPVRMVYEIRDCQPE